MASYATPDDLRKVLPARAIPAWMTDDILQEHIDAASDEFDSYATAQYTLPFTAISNDVKRKICWAAAYFAMVQRGYTPEGSDSVYETQYNRFLEWARLISRGMLSPPGLVDSTPTVNDGGAAVLTTSTGPVVGGGVASQAPSSVYVGGMATSNTDAWSGNGQRGW